MSQLIQLRGRIKAIETIKKITHAMRLISMSSHTRMRSKDDGYREYLQALSSLATLVKQECPTWQHPRLTPSQTSDQNNLIILVGSQRGLCGNFNTVLFHFFENTIKAENTVTIPIGKKAVTYLASKKNRKALHIHSDLTISEIPRITESLIELIMQAPQPYSSVTVISNKLKTFFVQKPQITQLIPYTYSAPISAPEKQLFDYHWEQDPAQLLEYLSQEALKARIKYLLFQSLLAEQAARFISMDNATRNAQSILDTTKLSYNKLRQAKITKELTELSGIL